MTFLQQMIYHEPVPQLTFPGLARDRLSAESTHLFCLLPAVRQCIQLTATVGVAKGLIASTKGRKMEMREIYINDCYLGQ